METKIHWVKWKLMCAELKDGGLGLRDLEWFNKALMSKWLWRFLTEKQSLWARVVRICKGDICWDERGFRVEGNREMKPSWWKKVLGLSWGEDGKWLRDNLEIQIGEGDTISFWNHCWSGETRLKEVFPRLFRLSKNQSGSIQSSGKWMQGKWCWNLEWKRELRDREKDQVSNLTSRINNHELKEGEKDGWRWKAESKGLFSVKSAYKRLYLEADSTENRRENEELAMLWKAPAMYKAKITAWRTLKGRMATCENLQRRQVLLSNSEAMCVLCKEEPESGEHLFLFCKKSTEIWYDILRWFGKETPLNRNPKEHFLAFINLGNKVDQQILSGAWICTIWCLWKWRNDCKFNQEHWSRDKMLAEIKTRLWGWKSAYNITNDCSDFKLWFNGVNLLD